MTINNPDAEQVEAWIDEERWHLENATLDMSVMLRGVSTGEALADAEVFSLAGAPLMLSSLWQSGSVLLVTSSMTCPPSRQVTPALTEFAERYPKLQIVVLYVIDAHPAGDLCPYTGTDWLTKDNREAGIRHPQPKTQQERNALAAEFRTLAGLTVPVVVDNMANTGWVALGRVPNSAVLIDSAGCCVFSQPWLRPDGLPDLLADAGY
jgi:thiol-disulfide isomerase/thioredoxin